MQSARRRAFSVCKPTVVHQYSMQLKCLFPSVVPHRFDSNGVACSRCGRQPDSLTHFPPAVLWGIHGGAWCEGRQVVSKHVTLGVETTKKNRQERLNLFSPTGQPQTGSGRPKRQSNREPNFGATTTVEDIMMKHALNFRWQRALTRFFVEVKVYGRDAYPTMSMADWAACEAGTSGKRAVEQTGAVE